MILMWSLPGRRANRLETLEEEIRSRTGADVLSLTFDIRDREAVERPVDAAFWKMGERGCTGQ
jgi:NADP-dependent 3-hydroxy acid dehydrogenase YdfG